MRRLSKKLRALTTRILDLPQDVMFDLPRITLVGNSQLYIENHRGVLRFTDETLRIALTKGELEITGQQLVIHNITKEEVFIEGTIRDMKYIIP